MWKISHLIPIVYHFQRQTSAPEHTRSYLNGRFALTDTPKVRRKSWFDHETYRHYLMAADTCILEN